MENEVNIRLAFLGDAVNQLSAAVQQGQDKDMIRLLAEYVNRAVNHLIAEGE